jgi:hypothetical protein
MHVCNTFFEWELETHANCDIDQAFLQNPIFLQLQFLPLLYAREGEGVIVTDLPDPSNTAPLFTFADSHFPKGTVSESWGASWIIAKWAKKHAIPYCIPDWQVVRQVNSKQFSFENGPPLTNAALLTTPSDAQTWFNSFDGKKVLKSCYGVSGGGHLLIEDSAYPWEKILSFLEKQWKKQLPVIAEPWVSRQFDFSTQWFINQEKHITYLGSTLCHNDQRGQYTANDVGDENLLFGSHLHFLHAHKKAVEPILRKMATLGYFGNVGIDAMVYTQLDHLILHPIVEINARKTMGFVALQFQKHHFPNDTIRFSFSHTKQGYLPDHLQLKNGKTVLFKRNLTISVYN